MGTRRWVSWVFSPIQESWGLPRPGVVPAGREGGTVGGAQGGEAVSRHKLHPTEDDRSLPRAVVSP